MVDLVKFKGWWKELDYNTLRDCDSVGLVLAPMLLSPSKGDSVLRTMPFGDLVHIVSVAKQRVLFLLSGLSPSLPNLESLVRQEIEKSLADQDLEIGAFFKIQEWILEHIEFKLLPDGTTYNWRLPQAWETSEELKVRFRTPKKKKKKRSLAMEPLTGRKRSRTGSGKKRRIAHSPKNKRRRVRAKKNPPPSPSTSSVLESSEGCHCLLQ